MFGLWNWGRKSLVKNPGFRVNVGIIRIGILTLMPLKKEWVYLSRVYIRTRKLCRKVFPCVDHHMCGLEFWTCWVGNMGFCDQSKRVGLRV